jgi:hypothetical protein
VVHGADECAGAAALSAIAVLAIGAVLAASAAMPALSLALTLRLALGLVGIVLGMSAETAFTTPLMPVSRVVRLLWCFIHAVITLSFWSVLPDIPEETSSPGWGEQKSGLNSNVKSSVLSAPWREPAASEWAAT